MKLIRTIWLCALVFVFAAAARANPIDPGIGLGGGGSQGPFNQNGCPVLLSCTITLDSTGSGVAQIINNTGFDLVSDTIGVENAFGGVLTCLADTTFGYPFVTGGGALGSSCTYSETSPLRSIAAGQSYDIFFSGFCTGTRGNPCGTGFLTSLTFDLTWVNGTNPNPVPEPGTILLLGTGLAAVVARRRQLKRRATSA